MLALYAERIKPPPRELPDQQMRALRELCPRREKIVEMLVVEEQRLARASQALRREPRAMLTISRSGSSPSTGVDPVWFMVSGRKEEGGPQCQEPIHHMRWSIVELARVGRSINELAQEFEASANAIRKWVRQAALDEGLRSDGLNTSEREELNRLRRENRVLREECEILTKAAAWFAQV